MAMLVMLLRDLLPLFSSPTHVQTDLQCFMSLNITTLFSTIHYDIQALEIRPMDPGRL